MRCIYRPWSSNQKSYSQCLRINSSCLWRFFASRRACLILSMRRFSLISKNIHSKKANGRRNTHTHHSLAFNIGLSCLRILAMDLLVPPFFPCAALGTGSSIPFLIVLQKSETGNTKNGTLLRRQEIYSLFIRANRRCSRPIPRAQRLCCQNQ